MIKKLKLKNFRNFDSSEFLFCSEKNFIIWANWKWKTNILEAISLLSWKNFNKIDFPYLVKSNQNIFFIEITDINENKIAISFDKEINKKQYFLNWKKTTKSKIKQNSPICVNFSPITMNLMYLSPSLRRDFLDNILINTFPNYSKILKEYKNILTSRNKLLKAIKEWKAREDELNFWDNKFINITKIVYNYRFWISNFFKENIGKATKYFLWKINKIEFKYISKINNNIEKDIKQYLEKNRQRDIILTTTQIWPHIDDFNIFIDNKPIIEFASRWETKSVIIELKFIEIKFIEKFLNQKPILLIDDLLSELDNKHKSMILDNITWYQTFITSINDDNIDTNNKIFLN